MATSKPNRSDDSPGLSLLFADDERSLQELMKLEIPRMGHRVTVCPDGLTAVAALEKESFDCLLVDLDMPGLNGIDVIARAEELCPDAEAVVLTGKSSLESAIAALRHGAFDYLTKPCKLVEIEALLRRVREKRQLTQKYRALERRLQRIEGTPQLVGKSAGMERVRTLITKVAPTQSTVLILGETGTGKELVARAVHDQSLRAGMPMVAINCGALPETLAWACSKWPTAARFSSTKSASCPRRCRPSCSACWRAAKSAASATTARSWSTCESSAPPTATWAKWWPRASSAKT
jgi:DNA-binding NtrC family response regulator